MRHLIQSLVTKEIEFSVPGKPVGKPRMTRSDTWKARPSVLRYRAWADVARLCLAEAGGLPDGFEAIGIEMTAYIKMASSWPKKKRTELGGTIHQQKPDADNLLKCADALFKEDKGIVYTAAVKFWLPDGDTNERLDIRLLFRNAQNGG